MHQLSEKNETGYSYKKCFTVKIAKPSDFAHASRK